MRSAVARSRHDGLGFGIGLGFGTGLKFGSMALSLLTLLTTTLLTSILISPSTHAIYSASLTVNDSVELDIVPGGDGTSIHAESINVQSDCRNGYYLTIATPNNSDLYMNGDSTSSATFTAVDGTSALNSNNNTNKWGYTITSNPTSSTVFSPLSATASTLKTPSQTISPSSDINDTFNINYGIKVADTIAPGTYQMADSGAIVYYLTMDISCTQYTVEFNPNGGTLASGVSNPTQDLEAGESAKLDAVEGTISAPTTASYTDAGNNTINGDTNKLWTFWGWNTSIDGTGDWYKDRESVEDLTNAGSTITLYAQWKQATLADLTTSTPSGTEKVINHNTMQDMSPEACYNSTKFTAIGTAYGQATLIDTRDGITKSYRVAKLPDDTCWMTDNLNLGTNTSITLTSDDTDLADNATFTLPASNPNDFSTLTASTNINKATVLNNLTIPDYTVNSTTYSGKIGAYYSFAAATADTSTYSKNSSVIVTTSICPKNWDLPTTAQYYNLRTVGSITTYNNTNASYEGKNAGNEPYYFIYGGYRKATGSTVNTTSFNSPTSYGYLWTANNSSYRYGYGTYVNSSGLYNSATGTTYYKYYGLSMRCVASSGKATINYDGNGTNEYPVTGTVATQENVEISTAKTQPGTGFTRTGWGFTGWNTRSDGSGIAVAAEAPIDTLNLKPGEVITLYAQWTPQYTITYVNNCKTYASTNASCTDEVSGRTSEQKIDLASSPSTGTETGTLANYNNGNTWNLTGWKIKGWSTVADNSDNTNTEYKVSSTYTVPAGSGLGDGVTLYAHWVPVYSIQYDGNGASNTNGMGTIDQSTGVKSVKQTNIGEGDPVTLLASNFKRAGYGFAGWSTNPNATVTSGDKIYGSMETIDAPAYPTNGTNIITMYAVWVPAKKDGNNNPVYLQDFTHNDCDALTKADFNSTTGVITPGSVIALTDKRDDQVYTIAKLADGNCWMTENLRLEHEGTVGNNKNDSSVTNESLSQGYGGTAGTYGNFVGLADPESANFSNVTTSNSIYKSDGSGDVFNSANNTLEDIGTSNNPQLRFPRYNSDNTQNLVDATTYTENYTNASNPSKSGTFSGDNLYSYGNYYTWAAAIANTNYLGGGDPVDTSICPTNWHLPSIDDYSTTEEFNTLSRSYGGTLTQTTPAELGAVMSNRFRTFPNNFLYSGVINGSSKNARSSTGDYWSRYSYGNGNYTDYLSLGSASFHVSYDSKYKGYSVRCLADHVYTIQYDGNGADNPNGMGTTNQSNGVKSIKQTAVSDATVRLLASNFKRAGHGFAGWSTDPDAYTHFTDNDNTNDPVIYGPMEDVVIDSNTFSDLRITMYAVWVPAKKDGNNNPVYLQDFTTSDCSALTKADFNSTTGVITPGSVIALTDKRDDQVYTIAKLADGNCWMTENLRLEHEGTVGNNKNDSSVTNESLSQGYGGTAGTYGNFVGLADPESANFSYVTTSNSIYKSDGSGDVFNSANNTLEDIGTSSSPAYRFPRYNSDNTQNLVDGTTYNSRTLVDGTTYISGTFSGANLYSYGNYYTWAAAMANTNFYPNSSTSEAAGTSICPSNWHLPSGGGVTGEYRIFSQSYGWSGNDEYGTDSFDDTMNSRFRTFPNNFLYSGYFNGSSIKSRGSLGDYWSRSAIMVYGTTTGASYSLNLGSINYADAQYNGFTIRCLIGS